MITLALIDGKPALCLGTGKQAKTYALVRHGRGWRLSQGDGKEYATSASACNCPASRFRAGPCKHRQAITELEGLIRGLQ
jgi:hypothetical protein